MQSGSSPSAERITPGDYIFCNGVRGSDTMLPSLVELSQYSTPLERENPPGDLGGFF